MEKISDRMCAVLLRVKQNQQGCWIWQGATTEPGGYGIVNIDGVRRQVTHVVWRITRRRWPTPGRLICHTCDTPSCIRPSHLWEGTAKENTQDAIRKGRWSPKMLMAPFERGEKHRRAKLTDAQVAEIRTLRGKLGKRKVAAQFGVGPTQILRIWQGQQR